MKGFDVHIHTNTDCNLQCRHCYNNSGTGPAILMQKDVMMGLLQLFGRESDIHLEGGEIMLHPPLLASLCNLPDDILRIITITTNGTILTEDPSIIQMLRKIGCFRISIEGHTQESHGLIRNSSLQQVLGHAARYQTLGIPVTLRITLHEGNRDTLFCEGIPALIDQGFRRFQIYELQRQGRGITSHMAISDNFNRILEDFSCMDCCADVKLMLSKKRTAEVLNARDMLLRNGAEVTFLEPENSISICANGNITVCPWSDENTLGNVNAMSSMELIRFWEQDIFIHTCDYCSRIRLRKERI